VLAEGLDSPVRPWCPPPGLGAVRRQPGPHGRHHRRLAAGRPRHVGRPRGSGIGRPLLAVIRRGPGRPRRRPAPLYEEVADVVVDVDDLDPPTVVDRILAATAFARSLP